MVFPDKEDSSELRPEQVKKRQRGSTSASSSVSRILVAHQEALFVPMSTLLLHNFYPEAVTVPLDLTGILDGMEKVEGCQLWDILGDDDHSVADDGSAEIQLEGYGYRWLRIRHAQDRRPP